MAGDLTLRVITPDRIVLDETASAIQIPALDGAMGILPRHAPMVVALATGLVHYKAAPGIEGVLFVAGGFAEVRSNTVRIVTQAGEKAEDIDEERALAAEQRARRRIEERRGGNSRDIDVLRAEASLQRAMKRRMARAMRFS